LHFAAQEGDLVVIRLLLDRRADLDVQSKKGSTPLQIAAKKGNEKAEEILSKASEGLLLHVKSKCGAVPGRWVLKSHAIDPLSDP